MKKNLLILALVLVIVGLCKRLSAQPTLQTVTLGRFVLTWNATSKILDVETLDDENRPNPHDDALLCLWDQCATPRAWVCELSERKAGRCD